MKKTFNINVAGFPFTIDDDAYSLLSDYLDTIEHAFAKQEDGAELANDIESRVAELLLGCISSGSPIISSQDVEQVIARIGQPEEMIENESDISSEASAASSSTSKNPADSATPPPYNPPKPPIKRKLFRDPQNAMLGGVCSGLAWYMNANPAVIRLVTVLLTVLSIATCTIAYFILWIIIPEAKTPLERMQMMGKEPTVENIGKTVTGSFREDSNPQDAQPFSSANSLIQICYKIAIALGMVIAVIILGGLVLGLIGCVFTLVMFGTSCLGTIFGEISPVMEEGGNIPIYGLVCGIGSILVIGIPLFLLVRRGWNKKSLPISTGMKSFLVILWILGFVIAAISAGRIVNIGYEIEQKEQQEYRMQQDRDNSYGDFSDNDSGGATPADSLSADSTATVTIPADSI